MIFCFFLAFDHVESNESYRYLKFENCKRSSFRLPIVPSYNGAKASTFSRLKNYVKKTRYIWTKLDFIDAR